MKKQHKQCIFFLSLFFVAIFCLSSCDHQPAYIANPIVYNLQPKEKQLLSELGASDIQIIKQGMLFTFVIPTDSFFSHTTHELKTSREADLDRLAHFLDLYSEYFVKPKITITGYTDDTWLAPARNLLSLHYAEVIAQYFREDGLDSKMIIVSGNGAKDRIATNRHPLGASFNRRVVITIPG